MIDPRVVHPGKNSPFTDWDYGGFLQGGKILPLGDMLISCSFNCLLPAFACGQYAECQEYDGKCSCPPGFGGEDCMQPGISRRILRNIGLIADMPSLWVPG